MSLSLSVLIALFINNPFILSKNNSVATGERVEIVIEGNDQIKFNLSEIKVSAGDTVVIKLKHVGKLPKAAMGHNWVLLPADTDVKDFAAKALKARDNDYIPEDEETIAYTALIGGGEETSVEFVAPEAGEYTFICSFPGHYALMSGKFIVE